MADTENTTEESRKLGFIPKLLLWSLVLLFGYLYLSALRTGDDSEGAKPAAVAELPPGGGPAAPAVRAEPPAKQPAAAPAMSTVEPASPPPPAAAAAPQPVAAVPPQQPGDQVSKTEAEAFAHAVISEESKPAEPEPAAAPAGPSEQPAPAPGETATAPAAQAPQMIWPGRPGMAPSASEIERLRSHYLEARRQAVEEARQRWEQFYRMRPSAPAPFYGYPGYYPAPVPAPPSEQPKGAQP
jgi:outer membrane biosynthesis protein TonB